jgi:carboxyl-terminal processing protease
MMSEEPKSNYKLPLLLAIILCAGLWVGNKLAIPTLSTQSNSTDVQKLNDILNLLDERYVDKINKDSIYEETISEMLHKLDPHSNYMSAKDMKAVNEGIDGKFGGIGVRFLVLRDTICVSHVIEGSPSDFAGVKAGDKIIEINGKSLGKKKIETDDVMSKLKGEPGTEVQIKVLRKNVKKNITITRDLIPIRSVSCAYMIDKNTGYILIDQFSVPTADEFHQEAKKLKSLGMTKLVLDLRNNPGGVLTSATDIADEFLPGGMTMLKTKGRRTGEQIYKSKSGDLLEKMKVVVLINSNSASASEILAGALQDNDRAVIVGRRSFGKGLVQEDRALRDGSNLRITIARYYTPSGRCIQRPYSGDYEDYMKDEERFLNGELYQADKQKLPDSLKFKTRKGRIVYGGGGIYPDVFVPLDSTGGSFYLTELQFSGAFNAFTFDYVKDKRNKWISAEQFVKTFEVDDAILKSFCAFSSKNFKVTFVDGEFKKSKQLISKLLKAEIGRQIWTEEGFYRVINPEDNEFKEAIRSLER